MAGTDASAIGSAPIISDVGVLIQKLISPKILGFFERRKLDEGLIWKLIRELTFLSGALADAEEKQTIIMSVKNWVFEAKDVVYEAEDLLDGIDLEVLRFELESRAIQTAADQMRNIFSLNFLNTQKKELLRSLKACLERLQWLKNEASNLELLVVGEREPLPRSSIPTSSPLVHPVYGMENAKVDIIQMILSDDDEIKHLEVIPIVGMGGIGKSTLAKLIYNDADIVQRFDLKAWVCVADEFDVLKLTKQILEGIGVWDCDYLTADEIRGQLQRRLMGKKFLLVLDDVWSEDPEAWSFFLTLLGNGASSCEIIITTQSRKVAAITSDVPPYQLRGIDDDVCWQLFSRHAFASENWNASSQFEERFRWEIVARCSGNPLAAKSLGCLLRLFTDAEEWEVILKSNLWFRQNDRIFPGLVSRYHYLPSHLKRCFEFCAIFPKDYSFRKEELILLWIAEGFVVPLDEKKDLKEVGNQFFQELESMSFFQQAREHSQSFMMEGLMRNLAEFVSEGFSFRLDEVGSYMSSSSKIRHLSCASTRYEDLKNVAGIDEFQNLRTFLTTSKERFHGGFKNEELRNTLRRFKRLRVLSFSNISELPDSIGDLKHLRYLNLSETSIERLPERVSALYHLQILILCRCRGLVELPTNMMKLTSLCHLDIRETRLQGMPQQIGKLTELQTLTDFFVGKQNGSGIKELGKLKCLQGKLFVWNLQNVDVQDASTANLKGMEKLKELTLSWSGDADGSLHEPDLLVHLQPHTDLEVLAIVGYRGTKLADWVRSLSNIITLRLSKCKNCPSLPPLGQLPSLKSLLVEAFDEVKVVGSEFYGSCTSNQIPFKSLESLTFESMPQWLQWSFPVGGADGSRAFPRLQVLCIRKCPKLRRTDLGDYPSIKKITLSEDFHKVQSEKLSSGLYNLTVDSFHSLDSVLEEIKLRYIFPTILQKFDICHSSVKHLPLELFPKLEQLDISRCPNLISLCAREEPLSESTPTTSLKIFEFPALKSLALSNCASLKSVQCCFPSLVNLKITYCHVLESFPGVVLHTEVSLLSKLRSVHIHGCNELFAGIKKWVLHTEVPLSSKLKSLHIHGCNELFAGIKKWDLQRFPSLSSFSLGDCEQVDSFPLEKMLLPSKLSSLSLHHLPNMTSLNHEGLRHLTCLEKLEMEDCPELQSMPEGGLPVSLSFLSLKQCPLLEKRCRREIGEDWPKISAITNIKISEDSSSYYNRKD